MNKLFVFLFGLTAILFVTTQTAHAQMGMMGGFYNQPSPSQSDLQDEQTMQDAGQKIYQQLQDKKITCQQLTSDDYEKLGEYFMGQAAGSTQNHVYWDQRIQSMMGETGDTQMHIVWGERGSGCVTNAALPSNTPSFIHGMMGNWTGAEGGVFPMMGWGGYGVNGMMGGNFGWGFGILGFLIWLVAFVDLLLLGIFLWKRIRTKK